MRVLFELDAALRNRYSGFYTFASGLINAMDRLDNPPKMVFLYQKRYKRLAEEMLAGLGPWATGRACPFKFRWIQNLWNISLMPSIQRIGGCFDLYHCFHHFMPPRAPGPRLLTVHDLRRYVLPELYPKSSTRRFETAVSRADHFLTISQASKRDLCRIFDISSERVDVVPLGCSMKTHECSQDEIDRMKQELRQQYNLPFTNYLVVFSSSDARKNIRRTADAFKTALPDLPENTGLVILGALPSSFTNNSNDIFTPGTVGDIIPWLVCSRGLVFASLYEGFGLPILEGFAAGVPVITSNCSSMPEVAGDAALLVDPGDTRQIRDAIKTLLNDDSTVRSLVKAGKRRLRKFRWKRSAEATVKIYKRLCRTGNTH